LVLRNPSEKTVLFKVKTTAPKQYCVRPNSGVLEPSKHQNIAVMLQPSADLSSVDKSKHKFMVQSMYAPPNFVNDNLDQVWRNVVKSELMDSKLKCSFVEDESQQPAENSQSEPPPPYSQTAQDGSGVEEFGQAEAGKEDLLMTSATGETILQVPSPPQQMTDKNEEEPVTSSMKTPAAAMVQSSAGSTPAHVSKSERETAEAEAKMRAMQDRIDLLTSENSQLKGESSQLRERVRQKPGTTTATTKFPPAGPSPPPSSPLNIIAVLLILVALVLGYLVGRLL
jgi:vesicle-associated membrane protein-associated protein A